MSGAASSPRPGPRGIVDVDVRWASAGGGSERVGPYEILDVIGRGGTGVVFRARQRESGEVVALKRVLAANVGDIGAIRREIDALRRLEHPGIVRILDQGIDAAVPWYAMELLEGETLAGYVTRLWGSEPGDTADARSTLVENVPPSRVTPSTAVPTRPPPAPGAQRYEHPCAAQGELQHVLRVIRRLCDTLGFVHGEGVVHRDLKCANVMIGAGGMPKLLDFGLAWRFPGGSGREVLDAAMGGAAGTAAYMSPEQVRGEIVDARADLYSLGCVLYELVTGRPPFTGRSAAEVRRCHLNAAVIPPSSLVDGVPRALDDLLLRLLQKQVGERPGHAREVARVLASLGVPKDAWDSHVQPRSYLYRAAIVGRTKPLQMLNDHVSHALESRGSLLLISGESGIGKTYLALAAARDAASRGMYVVSSTCASHGVSGGHANEGLLHPFRNLLLAIADRCSASPELTDVLLGERAKVLAVCEPSLVALPGIARHPEPEPLPASAARERLLAALADTLAAFATVSPFVFIVDDLQWADDLSLGFLSSLPSRWMTDKRLVIVGIYRADEETEAIRALRGRADAAQLELGRLSERSLGDLVRGMLALGSAPADFVELFVRQSGGNPFFAAEYLRAAVDEGLLYRGPTGYWQSDARLLATDGGESRLALPESIAAVVGRRLDGLSEAAQRMLAAAAVLGQELEWSLLLDVGALSDEEAWQPMRELCARQIIEEQVPDARGAGARFRFLHDKLREAAHARTPVSERRALHRRAAEAIERQLSGTPELSLGHATLAYHHTQAEQLRLAIEHLELAGEHALGSSANRDAVRHFAAALELDERVRREGDPAARGEPRRESLFPGMQGVPRSELRRARWQRKLAEAHYALGDLDAVERHVLSALRHTRYEPPKSGLGWKLSLVTELARQLVHRAGASKPVRLNALDRETLVEAALATHHLAERSYYNFDSLPMLAASLKAVNLGERAGVAVPNAIPYALLGMSAGISKLSGLAQRYFELAQSAAKSTGDDAGMAYSLYAEAAWKIGVGDWHAVRTLCAECMTIARRTRNVKALGMAQTLIGHADFYTGRFRRSARVYRELEETARGNGDQQHLSWGLYAGARARLCLGETEQARAMLRESTALLEPLVEVPSKIIAPGLLASAELRAGDLQAALELADLTAARIAQSLPTVFATVAGYAAVAEVYLARWQRLLACGEQGPEVELARARARRAVADLRRLAVSIPIGWPCYHQNHGEFLRADGDRSAAARVFERGLLSARKLGMRHDEALAHLALAELAAPRTPAWRDHLERAKRMLERLECAFDLERVRQLERNA
jgi:serine/threonine protein kinase/tetratricopeptide (TPR) repeat protein